MRTGHLRTYLAMLVLALTASAAHAQAQKAPKGAPEFKPEVGQMGKDVIWVPTPESVVKRMLEMAKVGPKDFVVDLGSGDGRTVIAAARDFGATAMGVEFNPKMVELSRKAAIAAGVARKAQFTHGDIFAADFSKATVITMYLLSDLNLRLRPKILEMKPGTRVVSHSFTMAEWDADQTDSVDGHGVYFWVVPANVAGSWTLQQPGGAVELAWTQTFQKLQGLAKAPGGSLEVRDAVLSGERISFVLIGNGGARGEYSGQVREKTMAGTLRASGKPDAQWSASRR